MNNLQKKTDLKKKVYSQSIRESKRKCWKYFGRSLKFYSDSM